jgi:hypothetical protein
MRSAFLLCIVALIATGCGETPSAPFTPGNTPPSAVGNLRFNFMSISDDGQGPLGEWQYAVTIRLSETAGVDVTVTDIRIQALLDSDPLATATAAPMVAFAARSTNDAGLVFAAGTRIADLSKLRVDATVQFRDVNGHTGSVSTSFAGFGAWDY